MKSSWSSGSMICQKVKWWGTNRFYFSRFLKSIWKALYRKLCLKLQHYMELRLNNKTDWKLPFQSNSKDSSVWWGISVCVSSNCCNPSNSPWTTPFSYLHQRYAKFSLISHQSTCLYMILIFIGQSEIYLILKIFKKI